MNFLTSALFITCVALSWALYQKSSGAPASDSHSASKKKNKKGKKKPAKASSSPEGKQATTSANPAATAAGPVEASTIPIADSTATASADEKKDSLRTKGGVPEHSPPSSPSSPTLSNSSKPNAETSAWTNDHRRQAILKIGDGVQDDMRDEEVDPKPKYNHVARIEPPREESIPHVKVSRKDREAGWESVGGGGARNRFQQAQQSSKKVSVASSNPFSALPNSDSIEKPKSIKLPSATSAASILKPKQVAPASVSEPTKRQRQNAARAAAKKQAKEAEEKERLERLARHRKELERERMKELDRMGRKAGTNGRTGPVASVNERGVLVWD
ncbi:hypothetical protein IE53DRAFT_390188 [Violaceomyces palustris]|uniref:Uncharacterized protein n=1 Tax=Violaceomyces palustris TaxID=1673888 RepID=A0ACD0NPD2_9BASI|nr:hypothetical protein IE53DRAFT_390188 [Violaceomyces palustris]